jgi:hypothetical protein
MLKVVWPKPSVGGWDSWSRVSPRSGLALKLSSEFHACIECGLVGPNGRVEWPYPDIPRTRALEIAFQSKPLRAVCEDETQANRELDADVVEALKHRLADLRAAATGRDVFAGRPRIIGGEHSEYMAIDLAGKWQLVFAANHVKNPRTDANACDWTKVTRVKVIRIENCDA